MYLHDINVGVFDLTVNASQLMPSHLHVITCTLSGGGGGEGGDWNPALCVTLYIVVSRYNLVMCSCNNVYIGEGHFGAHQQPYLYFKVLLLTAQFEAVSLPCE